MTPPRQRLVYNTSDSVPRGWYVISPPINLQPNDYVLAQLPPPAAALASARGYLPIGVPILKRIAARPRQIACIRERAVLIDGVAMGVTLPRDSRGRLLQAWTECRALGDEFFLTGDGSAASFDSRYFGPLPRALIIGRASLWRAS